MNPFIVDALFDCFSLHFYLSFDGLQQLQVVVLHYQFLVFQWRLNQTLNLKLRNIQILSLDSKINLIGLINYIFVLLADTQANLIILIHLDFIQVGK
jgi:hypothetical protein